jgi:hypothetical protein
VPATAYQAEGIVRFKPALSYLVFDPQAAEVEVKLALVKLGAASPTL